MTLETAIAKLKEMRDLQGSHGNWNCNEYMLGMYNGIEFSLCCLENRDPEYRSKPEIWLDDLPPITAEAVCG